MIDPIQKRLKEKFKNLPKWSEDFSIEAGKEKNVSRRDFIRFLAVISLGLLTGTAGVLFKSLSDENETAGSPVKISGHDEIAVGESKTFNIPGKREPGIMVRLGEKHYVAYGQKCTHLQCPVLWKKEENKLLCPCHNGAFDAVDGRVLYGPPERPLPQLIVELKDDGVYFIGVKNGIIT